MEKNSSLQNLLHIQPQKNMSDKIFEQLSSLIQNGSLEEGYVFPNETVLCEQLSIGRSTIREAYKALELSGYVTRTKRGTVVNGHYAILAATPLKAVIKTASEQDFFDFRLMLESQTAYLAASRTSEKELKDIKSTHSCLTALKETRQPEQLAEVDKQFHRQIAAASHNQFMITAMEAVAETWHMETKKNFFKAVEKRTELLDSMIQMHQAVINAIENHNPEAARKNMAQHIIEVSN